MTARTLQKVMPGLSDAKARSYAPLLNAAMLERHINTRARAAAFLAQLGHESVSLRYFEEIASGAEYEGRRDLGNTRPGDGKRFKGRGPIQLTGRNNYRTYGNLLNVPLEAHPQLAAVPHVGFRVAALFWQRAGLNELADRGDFITITRRINGGTNGLADRINRHVAIKRLGNDVLPTDPRLAKWRERLDRVRRSIAARKRKGLSSPGQQRLKAQLEKLIRKYR